MLKRLMVLGGMLAMMLVVAAPAFAQEGPITATGVLGEPYVLISGFVDLSPFVGQRITIKATPVGTAPGATPSLNVTDVESETGYDPAPLAVITGVVEALPEPIPEGGTHTITEASTGDVYMLWGGGDSQIEGIDRSQYEGQRVTVYGIFQTFGAPISNFEDPTDVLIAVTSVESLEPLPVAPPANGQYEDEGTATDNPTTDDTASEGSSDGGAVSVLPDTGGFSLVTLGLIAALLLSGGRLLAYNFIRR